MHLNVIQQSSMLLLTVLVTSIAPLNAAELVVKIEGIAKTGNIGCSLYSNATGFPMDATHALQQFSQQTTTGTVFVFSNLKSGKYAVSAMNDQNGNQVLDKNFLGVPKEEWGVSNNVRPALRAPSFEEASFEIDEKKDLTITIRIQKN